MKTISRFLLQFLCIIVLVCALFACNLPAKPDATVQSTTPPPASLDTPAPVEESTDEAVPSDGVTLADLVPVTGSVLHWIDESDFVYVPAGEYIMGQDEETPSDHAPGHTVQLDGFWIHQAEVTNQQYAACVEAGACTAPHEEKDTPYWYSRADRVNAPVVGVDWLQASEYCAYIESRLPTEAEWEYAARGNEDTTYPWGEDKPTCGLLNYNDCLTPSIPEDVRQYDLGASEFEAMDLAGNVSEWVNDWYAEDYYTDAAVSNPVGPIDGTQKVYRGGAFDSNKDEIISFARLADDPNNHSANRGFRCVLLGDYNESTKKVPRQCSVLPIGVTQADSGPTRTPYPCSPPVMSAVCNLTNSGNAHTSLGVSQTSCGDNTTLSLEINNTLLDCDSAYKINSGDISYGCIDPSLIQGAEVEVEYCQSADLPYVPYECPFGYELAPSLFCEPKGEWVEEPPCSIGYDEIDGMCMPNFDFYSGCPEGYYTAMLKTSKGYAWTCVPLDAQCLMPGAQSKCEQPLCPEGQTYDPANDCCEAPDKLKSICPLGLKKIVDPQQNISYCGSGKKSEMGCGSMTVKVPYCPTLTPTATPVKSVNCYTDVAGMVHCD